MAKNNGQHQKKTYFTIASGWARENSISFSTNPKYTGIKLFAKDMETGEQIELKYFALVTQEQVDKEGNFNEKLPSHRLFFALEDQENE